MLWQTSCGPLCGADRLCRLRLSRAEEALGIDKVNLGVLAYPAFHLTRRI